MISKLGDGNDRVRDDDNIKYFKEKSSHLLETMKECKFIYEEKKRLLEEAISKS